MSLTPSNKGNDEVTFRKNVGVADNFSNLFFASSVLSLIDVLNLAPHGKNRQKLWQGTKNSLRG